MVGGDGSNTRLKISNSLGDVWRDSVQLPYGLGLTSYGSSLFQHDGRIYLTGGFVDNTLTNALPNAKDNFELFPNSRFKKVGQDTQDLGGVAAVSVTSD